MKPHPSAAPPLNRLAGFVESVLQPLLPAILASTLTEAIAVFSSTFGLLSISDPIYTVLSAVGNATFYFLPIFLAYSLAGRIGCSRSLAILTAAILLHPTLTAWLAGSDAGSLKLSVRGTVYPGSVLPILATIPVIKWVERLAERFLPGPLKELIKPLAVLAAALPTALLIVGPLCTFTGNFIARGIHLLYGYTDWAAALLLSLFMPILILLGGHHPPSTAEDPLLWNTALFAAAAALFGTAIALLLRCPTRSARKTAAGGSIGALAGVPELALYGIVLQRGWVLPAVSVSAGLGGLYGMLAGALRWADGGVPSFFALLAAALELPQTDLENAQAISPVSVAMLFLLTAAIGCSLTLLVLPKRYSAPTEPTVATTTDQPTVRQQPSALITVASPLSGKVIPLSRMDDPAFAAGVMGRGCAILPVFGKVYAPADGTVTSVAAAGNSITFEGIDGVQLLIHIGKTDTSLSDRCYFPCCCSGDTVKAGDLLLSFDIDGLRRAGTDLTTPLLIINAERYGDLSLTCESRVAAGDRLLTLAPKEPPNRP